MKIKFNVTSIHWDTDGDRDALEYLPSSDGVTLDLDADHSPGDIKDWIRDRLEDKYGFDCVSFNYERA